MSGRGRNRWGAWRHVWSGSEQATQWEVVYNSGVGVRASDVKWGLHTCRKREKKTINRGCRWGGNIGEWEWRSSKVTCREMVMRFVKKK